MTEPGWMEPLPPEQGGIPYDPVHQREDGTWWAETPSGDNGPYLSEVGAREGLKAYEAAEEKAQPKTLPPAMTELGDGLVELDPEVAEHRLSHAAQDLVDAAIGLVRGTRSDVIVDRGDMKRLRTAVEKFDLAYATVITLGKIMALAEQAEQETPLGDNTQTSPDGDVVVDATYGEVPQEKLDARYEAMIAEREAELQATEDAEYQETTGRYEGLPELQEWPLPPENCPAPASDLAECLGATPQEP